MSRQHHVQRTGKQDTVTNYGFRFSCRSARAYHQLCSKERLHHPPLAVMLQQLLIFGRKRERERDYLLVPGCLMVMIGDYQDIHCLSPAIEVRSNSR